MKVFVDASAWIARQIKRDKNNQLAKKHYEIYKKQRALFYTNEFVLTEVYTRLIYDVHLLAAKNFHKCILSSIEKNQLVLIEIDPKDREEAWSYLQKFSDHKLSFTDATIIANFRTYKLDEIFTFDKGFKIYGLPTNIS